MAKKRIANQSEVVYDLTEADDVSSSHGENEDMVLQWSESFGGKADL